MMLRLSRVSGVAFVAFGCLGIWHGNSRAFPARGTGFGYAVGGAAPCVQRTGVLKVFKVSIYYPVLSTLLGLIMITVHPSLLG